MMIDGAIVLAFRKRPHSGLEAVFAPLGLRAKRDFLFADKKKAPAPAHPGLITK